MALLHRTRLFVNDLLSPFGFAINRVEKQPSKCFRTTVSIQERAQLYETSTGRYYLPTDAPQDWVISCIKSGGVFEPERSCVNSHRKRFTLAFYGRNTRFTL
jgi:hypothetical protein